MRHSPGLLPTSLLLLALLIAVCAHAAEPVHASREGNILTLSNETIAATWSVHDGALRWQSLTNRITGVTLSLNGSPFELLPKEGPVLRTSDFKIIDEPAIEEIAIALASSRAADRVPGRQIRIELEGPTLHITWKAVLREGASYVRQELAIRAKQNPFPLSQIILVDTSLPNATVSGQVKGSPVTADTWFAGFEHPLSECRVRNDRASCWLSRELPIQAGQSVIYSSVFGAAHPGQLRRDFLSYIELERAHPYRTFLHYNSWYDLGYFDRYTDKQALESVRGIGDHLTKERGVKLDSFLFDDGWDDPATLWHFNPGMPDGLANIRKVAAEYGAAPGIWFSPWGGYDGPKKKRLAAASSQGFETNEGGFALSGPKYYRYFRDACFEMIDKYGVNQFKFDGTGNANEVIKGSHFDSDFDAAIHLIGELRVKKPDIYINLTTGTYPSPFWLLYADSIWRGGDDHNFAAVGTNRQRWITYRDSQLYRWVVEDGPLFPINSLMLHGMIYARHANRLGNDPGNDFPDEVHSYFGTGTQLQEMYMTPSLLSAHDWDVLAETAKWSRANAEILKDSHWIGGDPARLEVYGWASWTPEKAIITLRNPSDKPQDFVGILRSMLELPAGTNLTFVAHSPWKADIATPSLKMEETEQHLFHLVPFEVLTLELSQRVD